MVTAVRQGGQRQELRLRVYVASVSVAGLAVLAALALRPSLWRVLDAPGVYFSILGLLLLGEFRPIRLNRGSGEGGEISVSTPFVFALLLVSGVAAAAVGLATATVLADMLRRKPWERVVFNAAQYTLSLAACGGALHVWSGGRDVMTDPLLAAHDLALVLAAGLVFFVLNSTLPSVAAALAQGLSPATILRRDFAYQVATAGVLTAVSPVIVLVAQHSVFLLPTLLLPALAVQWSAGQSLENEHRSFHDALTGLPNRSLFHLRVNSAIGRERQCAVMLIDLDHFKEVNDTLGHRAGDKLLVEVGHRLKEALNETATVARLGGDEFALLLPGIGGAEAAMTVADDILSTLTRPFVIDDFSIAVEASVGIAMYPSDGQDSGRLLRCADVAMYLAKDARSGLARYNPELDQHSKQRLTLMGQVRDAIEAREFVLHYQPKIDLQTGRVVGVEALVRWQHPDLGLLAPGEFIPLIERTVHMATLTRHVIEMALVQSRSWAAVGIELPIAVNVPANNLQDPAFVATVTSLLAASGLAASQLELEITEGTIMANDARGMALLHELSAMGIRLAIDDFGTGYSSLAYLKQLPVHTIKIDRSFVMQMASDVDDKMIVQSTVRLAKMLGLETVAEGVEDAATLEILRSLECEFAQGYHIARPMPASAVPEFVWSRARGLVTGSAAGAATGRSGALPR